MRPQPTNPAVVELGIGGTNLILLGANLCDRADPRRWGVFNGWVRRRGAGRTAHLIQPRTRKTCFVPEIRICGYLPELAASVLEPSA